jgi:Tfp pilus assembly protein PilF
VIGKALEEVSSWYDRDNPHEALASLKRAEGQLASGGAGDEMAQRVRRWRIDLDVAASLEEIRLERAGFQGDVDDQTAIQAYGKAFRDLGVDVEALDPDEAARRIEQSRIKRSLLAALDDWAQVLGARNLPGWKELLTVARRADRDAWRDRLREALQSQDWKTMDDLARDRNLSAQPPATIILLTKILEARGQHRLVVEVLRQAQRQHPADFWINVGLANNLPFQAGRHENSLDGKRWEVSVNFLPAAEANEAAGFLRVARLLRPDSVQVRHNLAGMLSFQDKWDDAEYEIREALRLNPNDGSLHFGLGIVHMTRGKLPEAEAEYRRAIELKADHWLAHNNLGKVLHGRGKTDEAEAEFRAAIGLKPGSGMLHTNLGHLLKFKKQMNDAEAEYRLAMRLQPEHAAAHWGLGGFLFDQNKHLDEAEAEIRAAVRLQPAQAEFRKTLVKVLVRRGKRIEAEAVWRPENPVAQYNFANELKRLAKLDEAAATYRIAISLDAEYADAHCNLGHTLREQGHLAEALAELKKGHEFSADRPNWNYPSEQWIARCERLIQLEARLPALLKGDEQPKDIAEKVEVAYLCLVQRRAAAAARLYLEAFAAKPDLAGVRVNAARAASLAGCGEGNDAGPLSAEERVRWRQRAVDWLRAELVMRSKQLNNSTPQVRKTVREECELWKAHPDFAGVRGASSLGKLPESERDAWRQLWIDTDALLQQAQEPAPKKQAVKEASAQSKDDQSK